MGLSVSRPLSLGVSSPSFVATSAWAYSCIGIVQNTTNALAHKPISTSIENPFLRRDKIID